LSCTFYPCCVCSFRGYSQALIGELGAGVIAGNAYRYFNAHGMDITGGYEQSVGIAGGFAQGGGVGSFRTTYGLMADNAVEFEVVTADGEVRIINECNDPDLFWAMRDLCSRLYLYHAPK
jgi:FAD/FMN-containing dehydrogenase